MVEQEHSLRRHLGTVFGSQLTGEIVERFTARTNLRHVFLVLPLQHVAAGEPLRPLFVDDVVEVGGRHVVDDLGRIFRVLGPQPDLEHFRLRRRGHLEVVGKPVDGILDVGKGRERRHLGLPHSGGKHERAGDQLGLCLAVRLVFTAAARRVGEHVARAPHAKPGHRLVALGQQKPGEGREDASQHEAEKHRRNPLSPKRMPDAGVVDAASQRILRSLIRRKRRHLLGAQRRAWAGVAKRKFSNGRPRFELRKPCIRGGNRFIAHRWCTSCLQAALPSACTA